MEELVSPLVLTKLGVPAVRSRTISRADLIQRLSLEASVCFVLVSAPAGYGKTTFLAEWAHSLENQGTAVAWYALDPDDDDPIPFRTYLIASLIQALGPLPELVRLAQVMRSSPEMDLQRILWSLINALVSIDRQCILVLDDYHLIASPSIHSALAYLLEHIPHNLHIAIGSRSDPPLPLTRLRVSGQMHEVRAESLRFTPAETARFLNEVMQLDLSSDMVEELAEHSEGWAAGLQLAALSLAGRPDKESFLASFGGSHRYLVEYLMEEVVSRQPQQVQSFLWSTSILERFCPPLCDALLNKPSYSETLLAQLEKANLFLISLDDRGYWYRYHHLFRDFLQAQLEKADAQSIKKLHMRASDWLAAQGFLREASLHAFKTQDWEYAAAFVEGHSFTLILHGDIATLYEWCSAFPENVLRQHPRLTIQYCLALSYSFQQRNREKVEDHLSQINQQVDALEDRQLARELFEMGAVVRTFLAMIPDSTADPRQLLSLSQGILANYSEAEPGQFSALLLTAYAHMGLRDVSSAEVVLTKARQIALQERLYFGYVESSFHLARLAHVQGRLLQAQEICRQGREEMQALFEAPGRDFPALGGLDIALGGSLMEQDQLEEAESCLIRGLELTGWKINPYYLMRALFGLARLREIQGRPGEAIRYLERLEETWPDLAFCTQALMILISLRRAAGKTGTLESAAAWLRKYPYVGDQRPVPAGLGPFGAGEAYYLAELAAAGFQIALGQAVEALPVLERRLGENQALPGRLIELSLLEAQAAWELGDEPRALDTLQRALHLGEAHGYIRIFDQGMDLTHLLEWAARRGLGGGYLKHILSTLRTPERKDTVPPDKPGRLIESPSMSWVECLSRRELEVLRLIANGASNEEIAGQLFITVGTVKSHINHLLRKLEAHNRTEAVARARELGWLDL